MRLQAAEYVMSLPTTDALGFQRAGPVNRLRGGGEFDLARGLDRAHDDVDASLEQSIVGRHQILLDHQFPGAHAESPRQADKLDEFLAGLRCNVEMREGPADSVVTDARKTLADGLRRHRLIAEIGHVLELHRLISPRNSGSRDM